MTASDFSDPRFVAKTERRSWGRVVKATHLVAKPRFRDGASDVIAAASAADRSVLGVGLGRSYGDSALNPDNALIDATGLDHFIAFDRDHGVVRAEAGVSLSQIARLVVPHGWFLPTTPGSRLVTVGGAIANDVHGKNHHQAGSFGCSVRRIGLVRSDRGTLEISPEQDRALFEATIGGLGLTGLITWAEIALTPIKSAFLDQETIPFDTLDGFFDIADQSVSTYEHTVSWIDCASQGAALGRGAFTRARWASDGKLTPHANKISLSLPIDLPSFALNRWSLKAFNAAYYRLQARAAGVRRVHYAPAFYPLDSIGSWNRLYGGRGFYQYQSVIPFAAAREATREMIEQISAAGDGSFLAVLKTFGEKASPGLLSFPAPGVTLALDFQNRGARTLTLMERLDQIVTQAGGRLYPAKDGRMSAAMFQAGYPRWRTFAEHCDPAFSSAFWRRVSVQ